MSGIPQTVVETAGYLKEADGLLTEAERAEIVASVGTAPEVGVIMPETGGVRKIRWGIGGRGKRGGVRVIYYFHSETIPVFLLNVFAKNEKASLSKAECKALKKAAAELAKYGGLR